MTQKFKGDAKELKMEAAGAPAFAICDVALDAYFEDCYTASDFLLMLYDEERMPFVDRVPRDSFIAFINEAIPRFPRTGTFETYIFILKAIFGGGTLIQFNVPAAGKIEMIVNAEAALYFDFVATEYTGSGYLTHEMITSDGAQIQFQGISGIDSEAELSQLLSELIPAGIFPDITLNFFTLSDFVSEDDVGDLFLMLDNSGNQIVFFET